MMFSSVPYEHFRLISLPLAKFTASHEPSLWAMFPREKELKTPKNSGFVTSIGFELW